MMTQRRRTTAAPARNAVLVTGGTGFLGSRLLVELARWKRPLLVLVRPGREERYQAVRERVLAAVPGGRIDAISGDLSRSLLGLSEDQRQGLRASVTEIFHLGALTDVEATREALMVANVEGTDQVLELARGLPSLRRFHFASSFEVSGDYPHMFYEDQLFVNQRFASHRALSKFRAEAAVRKNAALLPVTIYRLGALVGDSRTGEMPRLDGPYLLFEVLRRLRKLPSLWPLVGPGADHFVQMVPVDYAVTAIAAIARRERRRVGTFTLTDPRPPTYFEFFGMICDRMGLRRPRVGLPLRPLRRLLAVPRVSDVLERGLRVAGVPAGFLGYLHADGLHDTSNTEAILGGQGVSCPRVSDYLDTIYDYYLRHLVPAAREPAALPGVTALG